MALTKNDTEIRANYWKAFPMTKTNQAEMCLFKDGVDTVRGNALKRRIIDVDYSFMDYDKTLSLADTTSKYTYTKAKESIMTVKPEHWDANNPGETFVPEETNWFSDAVDNI